MAPPQPLLLLRYPGCHRKCIFGAALLWVLGLQEQPPLGDARSGLAMPVSSRGYLLIKGSTSSLFPCTLALATRREYNFLPALGLVLCGSTFSSDADLGRVVCFGQWNVGKSAGSWLRLLEASHVSTCPLCTSATCHTKSMPSCPLVPESETTRAEQRGTPPAA